jgi:hypothetical protein
MQATAPAGVSFDWFTAPVAGTFIGTANALARSYGTHYTAPGTYNFYVESVNATGCRSTRQLVSLNVPAPVAPTAIPLTTCPNSAVTLQVNNVPGAINYNWYSDAVGGTPLAGSGAPVFDVTVGVTNLTRWVTAQTGANCLESARVAVTATVNPGTANTLLTWTGATNRDWFNADNWAGNGTCAVPRIPGCDINVLIPSPPANQPEIGSNIPGAATANLTIDNGASITFTDPNSILRVCGNFTHNGNFVSTPINIGNLIFSGTATQTYTRAGTGGFQLVTIDNTAADPRVVVANSTLEAARLVFGNGYIQTTGANGRVSITSNDPSSIFGYNTNRYVAGVLRRAIQPTGNYAFPVGDLPSGQGYQLAEVNHTTATGKTWLEASFQPTFGGSAHNFSAYLPECGNDGYDTRMGGGFWRIEGSAGANGIYDLRVFPRIVPAPYNTLDYTLRTTPGGPGEASATLVKRGNSAAAWGLSGSCNVASNLNGGMGAVFVGRTAIADGFSDFDIVIDLDEPFPVELTNLKATPAGDHILVDWVTLTETNNKGFHLQRAEGQSQNFQRLGWLDGAGNSLVAKQYQYPDRNVRLNVPYYYRLEQVDFDGRVRFSSVVNAMLTPNGLFSISAYPNPSKGRVELSYNVGSNCCDLQVQLYDFVGKLLIDQLHNITEAQGTLPIDITNYAAGTYLLKVKINGLEQTLQILRTGE